LKDEKNMKKENLISKYSVPIAIVMSIIGLCVVIIFCLMKPFNDWSFTPKSALFAQYGDFIGGFVGTIFSLVAILLLYKTLIAQQDLITKQDDSFNLQKRAFEIESF